jgi:phosphoadenosine phosphosulfate reductase
MRLERAGTLHGAAVDRAEALNIAFEGASPQAVLRGALAEFPGEVALVSSFGSDSVVLLHMAAEVDRALPVLMIDTLMLFEETLGYQRSVAERLGLTNVQHLRPAAGDLATLDPDGTLHTRDSDACCVIRKVAPLDRIRGRWPVTISGRKRYQGPTRAALGYFEPEGERLKVNPLAFWGPADMRAYIDAHDLPRHPLVAKGYRSIGCAPCTTPVGEGEDERAGRWRGRDKVECGIHFGADGRVLRAS